MYFPLGAPSVYAQDLPTRARDASQWSQDGLDVEGSRRNAELIQGLDANSPQPNTPPVINVHEPVSPNVQQQPNGEQRPPQDTAGLVGMQASRNGQIFATITGDTITIWQTKPTVILSSVTRSRTSLQAYGFNASLLVRPDAAILVVHTTSGFLITYSLAVDPSAQSYQLLLPDDGRRHLRRRSVTASARLGVKDKTSLWEAGDFVQEAIPRFRMVIKVDAGIARALALDQELIVATKRPAAVQCIRWTPDKSGGQTSTALLSRMEWISPKTGIADMVYDRPMNMFVWIMENGRAYAVQRQAPRAGSDNKALFEGHLFHDPAQGRSNAVATCINSRFSTIALGCEDGSVWLYAVRDYSGNIAPLRHLQSSVSKVTSGSLSRLIYSPDGYCLLAGYEHGWATWTVFGQPGASSFAADSRKFRNDGDQWLAGVTDAFWAAGGSQLVCTNSKAPEIVVLEFARSALTGNMSPANIGRCLLQTAGGVMIYQGQNTPDLTTISADISLWHHSQVPLNYLSEQWPLRITATSADGRYIAVAGNRGLAHYSVNSGRWKTFEDLDLQNDFRVRGGMLWHQHILIAAVETDTSYEIRLFSRELPLERTLQVIPLNTPAIYLTSSGDDSILVYTHENVLDHYIVTAEKNAIRLSKVGQIGLHGIIRAPARVRAVSWVVPEHQMQNGDASKDVAVASVFFLVDGKLVLLQPSNDDDGNLRYDMRVIAHDVEYSFLARDCPELFTSTSDSVTAFDSGNGFYSDDHSSQSLTESLWLFDGCDVKAWTDVQMLLETASTEHVRDVSPSMAMSVDFYPLSILLQKGIVFGIEPELAQGHEANFSAFRLATRTSLFIPDILRYHLSQYDSPAALHLSHRYQQLPYFAHALEVLLHNVLDDEVENPQQPDTALLPAVLSFLSSFPEYLDVVVQCTRKTELRSWRTLFDHLPPPQELFETSLHSGSLKTAAGYLLVLHTLSDIHSTSPQVLSLLRAAKDAQDWELCKELARFLMALDESGATLQQALDMVDLASPTENASIDGVLLDRPNGVHRMPNGHVTANEP